jgi:WD40 repeat protein
MHNNASGQTSSVSLASHSDSITSLAFSSDGRTLVSGGYDHTAMVWEMPSGRLQRILPLREPLNTFALTPDAQTLVTDDRQVFEMASGRVRRTLRECATPLVCSPDGRILASCAFNRAGEGWDVVCTDLQFRHKKRRFHYGTSQADFLAFSADGALLGIRHWERDNGEYASVLTLYEFKTGRMWRTLPGVGISALCGVTFAAGTQLVAITSTGQIYDAETEQLLCTFDFSIPSDGTYPSFDDVQCSTMSHNGRFLAVGMYSGHLAVYETSTSRRLWWCEGHEGWVRSVRFAPDGQTLASAGDDQRILIWDAQTGELQRTLGRKRIMVKAIAFASHGHSLTACYSDSAARKWHLNARHSERIEHGYFPVSSPRTASPDNRWLAVIKNDSTIQLFDRQSGRLVRELSAECRNNPYNDGRLYAPVSLLFSPDSRFLAAGDDGFAVVLWNVETGKIRRVVRPYGDSIYALAWSPDSKMLASGSVYFREITLQDLRRGGKRWILRGHTAGIHALTFSPDGMQLASGSVDGTVRIWDTASGVLLSTLTALPDEEWMISTPSGTFTHSAGAEKFLFLPTTG